jgi:hypothetical protein
MFYHDMLYDVEREKEKLTKLSIEKKSWWTHSFNQIRNDIFYKRLNQTNVFMSEQKKKKRN